MFNMKKNKKKKVKFLKVIGTLLYKDNDTNINYLKIPNFCNV